MNRIKCSCKILLMIMIAFSLVLTSGCFDSIEVDELAYVVSLGIDKGTEGNLRLTMMIAVPIEVGVGPETGEIDKSSTLITVEAPTIYGGVNVINTLISKKLNFSHAKLLIISSDLAMEGVEKYVNTFIRFREFRPLMFLGITRGSAEEFLNETRPVLEVNPAKFFELLLEGYKYTGFTANTRLEHFYMQMECTCSQPVAVLLDVNKIGDMRELMSSHARTRPGDREITMEGDYKAGDIPVIMDNQINSMGLAVFRADKMVGEMTGHETLNYMMITGQLNHAYYSVPDPYRGGLEEGSLDRRNYVSLRISNQRNPVVRVNMQEEIPIVSIFIELEADILAIDSLSDYTSEEGRKKLENYVSDYIQKDVTAFIEKTRDVYNSDILGIGKSMKKKFFLWDSWLAFGWMDKYKNADFNITTNVSIRRSGITVKQIPVGHLKGGGQ